MRKKAIAEEVTKDITPVGWNYRYNDQPINQEDYQRLVQEHLEWVKEQDQTTTTDRTTKRSKK